MQPDIVSLKKRKMAIKNVKEAEDGSARKKKKEEINHEGLTVSIYDQAGWRFSSVLVHRDTRLFSEARSGCSLQSGAGSE